MTIELKRRLELEKLIATFCRDNELDMRQDIVGQLNKLGFIILKASFSNATEGMILVNEHIKAIGNYSSNKVILYDRKKNLYEARFIIAHELAHYIDKKAENQDNKVIVANRDHEDGDYAIAEQEKDYMAAALLIPISLLLIKVSETLKMALLKNGNSAVDTSESALGIIRLKNNDEFLRSMKSEFRVQDDLIKRRLDELLEFILDTDNQEEIRGILSTNA